MNQEKIGKFIQELRKEKNLTQQELGEKLGVTEKSISNWENGRNMPDLSLFKPLCEELNISINELMSGEKINERDYKNKLEENIINTINYSNKEINKKNNAIGIVLIVFGVVMSITAMSIFESASSLGGFYSVLGVIISLIGIGKITRKITYEKRFLICFSYYVLFIILLFTLDYIGVKTLKQAPRFSLNVITLNNIIYYDTPFYDVIRCDKDSKVETWNIEKNKKYTDEDLFDYCNLIAKDYFIKLIKETYKVDYVVISKLVEYETPDKQYVVDLYGNKNELVKVITDKKEIGQIQEVLKNANPIFGPVNSPGYSYLFQLGSDAEYILEFRMNELSDGERNYSISFSEEDKKILESFY